MTDARTLSLSLIGILLLGYVLGDRGVAHLGVGHVYVGEMVLVAGVLLLRPSIGTWLRSPIAWLLLLFNLWCLICTLPHIDEFGIDSLQDSVIYAYSAFAFLVCADLMREGLLVKALRAYGIAITVSVIAMPILLYVTPTDRVHHDDLPLIFIKSGDAAVHLAAAAVFRLIGLHSALIQVRHPAQKLIDWLFWACWTISILWTTSGSRGAMLALGGAFAITAIFGFVRWRAVGFIAGLAAVFVLFTLLSVGLDQERRNISTNQIVENAASLMSLGDERNALGELGSTMLWRLNWWNDILDYTVFGDYFWNGRGFGENLADGDRYQADPEGRLRSPHNAHLTILARAGVPGLALWLGFLGVFSHAMVNSIREARRAEYPSWERLLVWIMSYWTAALINASFDVYLEGPQGGIWFWSVTGLGMAAVGLMPHQQRDQKVRQWTVG